MTALALSVIVPIEVATFQFAEDEVPLAGQEGVVMAYVIRHPEATVLLDTGIGFGNAEMEERYHPRPRPILEAIATSGIDPNEIAAIVNCHLHVDHAGQNSSFPGVPIYVQPAEWQRAHEPDYTILEWIDFDGADYRQRAGDYELLPGFRVLSTPGHAPGHQSVVLDAIEGTVVLAGQAVYSHDEWTGTPTDREGASRAADLPAYENSIARLRALDPVRVYFAHDRAVWRSSNRASRAPV